MIACYAQTSVSAQVVNFNPENSNGSSTGNVADGFVLADNEFVCTGANAIPMQLEPLGSGTTAQNIEVSGNVFKNVFLACRGAVRNVTIAGNDWPGDLGGGCVLFCYSSNGGTPDGVDFTANTITDPTTTAPNVAVIQLAGTNSSIVGNVISGTQHYAATNTGSYPVVISGNQFAAGLHNFQNTGSGWISQTHPIIMPSGQPIQPDSVAGIVGTKTNDNASAGGVGELLSTISSGSFTTGTVANAATLSLSAGDWDLSGVILFDPAASTTVSHIAAGISTTSATLGALGTYQESRASFSTGARQFMATPTVRVSLAASGSAYLVGFTDFAVSTMGFQSFIRARRVR